MLALGVYPEVSLAEARRRREEARQLIANNVDPGEKRKTEKIEEKGLLILKLLPETGTQATEPVRQSQNYRIKQPDHSCISCYR